MTADEKPKVPLPDELDGLADRLLRRIFVGQAADGLSLYLSILHYKEARSDVERLERRAKLATEYTRLVMLYPPPPPNGHGKPNGHRKGGRR